MLNQSIKAFRGFLLDAPEHNKLRVHRDGALLVENGRILDAGEYARVRHLPEARDAVWQNPPSSVIIPGLIDLHTHLPQYPVVARQEGALLPWLEKHVFPQEKNFKAAVAKSLAPAFFQDLARGGATTAAVFTAIHKESCEICFQAADRSGLRIIMGKMMMDLGSYGSLPPEKILATSVEESRKLCQAWHDHDDGRLQYAVSPRFAVTCSESLLKAAAMLAKEFGCYVQTHLSENHDEIKRVAMMFPDCADYTSVYEKCGLLTPRTLFGHGIHLQPQEVEKLAAAESVVVHCPTSNLFLRSGIMPLDRWSDAGIRLGLGSDVAAGPELNLWQVMRSALESQIARSFYEEVHLPEPTELFHLATQGAAEALGKGSQIGSLDPGKEADFVVLNLHQILPTRQSADLHNDLTGEDVLSLLIHRGHPSATVETFVRGRSVYRATDPGLF